MEWLIDKFLVYGAIFLKVAWISLIIMIVCLVIVFIILFKEQKEKNKLIAKIRTRKMSKALKLTDEEQKQVGDIFNFAMEQGLCHTKEDMENKLFRATLSEIPEIGNVIVGYKDKNDEGRKVLMIADKLSGVILKIEKFEAGKWKEIFRD